MSAWTRGAPLWSAREHPEAEIDRSRSVPGGGEVDAQVAGAAGEIEHAAAGGSARASTARRRQRTSRRNVITRLTRS